MNTMTEQLGEFLRTLIQDRDFTLPIKFFVAGSNRSVMVGEYQLDVINPSQLQCSILFETTEGAGLACPINVFYSDSKGRSAHVTFDAETSKGRIVH